MKIIQTFWTAGQDPLKHGFGWTHPEYNLMSWALSCLSLREHYDEVELYTDSVGYHILIEVLQLPYTKTHVIFDDFQCLPHHWALSKIKTYSLQTEPFLHIDGDIYLPRPLPERVLNAPLVAQNREIGTTYYRRMMDLGVLKHPSIILPKYIENTIREDSIASYNMGVFGGTDLDFIQKYCKEVFNFMETNEMNNPLIPHSHVNCNVFFEQAIFAAIADQEKRTVEDITGYPVNDNGYTINEFCDLKFYEQKNFFHILGGHKGNSYILGMFGKCMLNMYPKEYINILSLFPYINNRFCESPDVLFRGCYLKEYEECYHQRRTEVKNITIEELIHWEHLSWESTRLFNMEEKEQFDIVLKCNPWIMIWEVPSSCTKEERKNLQVRLQCNIKHPIEYIIFWPTLHGSGVNEKASTTLERQILLKIKEKEIKLESLFKWLTDKYKLEKESDIEAIHYCVKDIIIDFTERGIICIPEIIN